jgi:hypothetical protein
MRLRRFRGRRLVVGRMVGLVLGRNCGRLIIDLRAVRDRLLLRSVSFRFYIFLILFSSAYRLRLLVFIYESFALVILFQIPNNAIYT